MKETTETEPLDLNDVPSDHRAANSDAPAESEAAAADSAATPPKELDLDKSFEPADCQRGVQLPTQEEMTEIHSLVAQLLTNDTAPINTASTFHSSALLALTPPRAEVVSRAEDVPPACSALGRRSALSLSLLHDATGIEGIAVGAADKVIYFDIRRIGGWPDALRDLLQGPVPKLVNNLDHSTRDLIRLAGIEPVNVVDLYAAAVLSDGYSRDRTRDNYGLDALVARLLRRALSSGNHRDSARCVREVGAMIPLYTRLTAEVERASVGPVWRRENDVVVPLASIEAAGFPLDVEKAQKLHDFWIERREAARVRLGPTVGNINLDSQEELRAALGAACGFAFTSTAKLHLRRLAAAHPFLRDVLAYREASVNVRNLEAWLAAVDAQGRVHAEFDALSAATGRMGCSNPALQSTPRSLRACWVAAPGCVLVIADYAAIELAIIADHTQDAEMISCFRRGIDLHRRTAAFLVRKKLEEITDGERTGAKAVNFGFAYAMGVATFLEHAEENYGLLLSDERGQTARAGFFRLYPGVAAWHERVRREGPTHLDLRIPSGRLRRFSEFHFPSYVNTPIQGVGACGFKRALALLHAALKPIDARVVHVQHDEVVVEVPLGAAGEASAIVDAAMVQAMSEFVTRVPVRIKTTVANTWAKA